MSTTTTGDAPTPKRPEYDAEIKRRWVSHSCEEVPADFARTLERELGEARALLAASQKREGELREGLKPFAQLDITASDNQKHEDNRPIWALNGTVLTVGDIRSARSLLNPPTP